jgi:hypothetical protein
MQGGHFVYDLSLAKCLARCNRSQDWSGGTITRQVDILCAADNFKSCVRCVRKVTHADTGLETDTTTYIQVNDHCFQSLRVPLARALFRLCCSAVPLSLSLSLSLFTYLKKQY